MTLFQVADELPEGFSGIVRVFPLPNLVLFPHVVQPLHVFEPRYRLLLEDALAGDGLIAMATLQPGWESNYEGTPPIEPMLCIGRVLAHSRLEDGRSNILLQGVTRAQLVHEFPPEHSFRLGEVRIAADVYPASGAARRSHLQRELLHIFQKLIPDLPSTREQFEQLLNQQLPLGVLVDIVAFSLPIDVAVKKRMLEEQNVDLRAELLFEQLRVLEDPASSAAATDFPPGFSNN